MVIQSRIVLTSVTPGCRPVRQTRIAETALWKPNQMMRRRPTTIRIVVRWNSQRWLVNVEMKKYSLDQKYHF